LFFSVRHDPRLCAIIATKNMWDIPSKDEKKHWNQPWPYAAAHALCGFNSSQPLAIADKSTFLGRYGTTAAPASAAPHRGMRASSPPVAGLITTATPWSGAA